MESAAIIGIDLAKSVFQLHGADVTGKPLFRKKLTRDQLSVFLASQSPTVVAMEACGSAHYWGREIGALGHDVKLIPPIYVKPFVKRHKNDAADAEAISEAAIRPTMRFVPVKSAEQQSRAMVFKTRDLLVRQRNQIVNALRGHLMEYGIAVPAGLTFVRELEREIEDPDTSLPMLVVELGRLLIDQLQSCNTKISVVERQMKEEAKRDPEALRLQTAPGVGPVSAMAIKAFGPDLNCFRRGRDFAAWLGLVPLQKSTGGKQKLGRTSKMGQRDIRRLLIIGAMTRIRWAVKNGAPEGSWLQKMLQRKPRLLIAIALANKTARVIWAMMTKGEEYRGEPVSA
ncbi:IS110 family transposase [Brucella pseudogrignonensis]|uniref:IS110 family transposase n=1 Tax=Brucella pseudogrignonensis TaxID=419475 RepID=UPI00124D0132|nr:IS110 family transposase [Brucella pseudogrignonensis]KAB2689404.1 IS110 family transposase [Brucella pseudogrignonensis]